MKEMAKKIWTTIINVALTQLIKYIGTSIFVYTVAIFSKDFTVLIFPQLQAYSLYLTGLFLSFAAFILYWFLKRSDNQPLIPKVPHDVKILERHIMYECLSKSSILYKRHYKIKATKDSVDRYEDRWNWTGDGTITPKSLIKSQSVDVQEERGIWSNFNIRFNRMLNKGEQIESEIQLSIDNISMLPAPFCSVSIIEPTAFLKFTLSFPSNFQIKEFICEKMHGMEAKSVISTKVLPIGANNTFEWIIKKPEFLHYYQIRWDWGED